MDRILRYAKYEFSIYFRVPIAVFYSLLFPLLLLTIYYFTSKGDFVDGISSIDLYFPYLLSIVFISSSVGSLANVICGYKSFNVWKFFNTYGYKTSHMIIALVIVYSLVNFFISIIVTLVMSLLFTSFDISIMRFFLFILVIPILNLIYMEISIIVGLLLKDIRKTQTLTTGLIFFFMFTSGVIVQFEEGTIGMYIIGVLPNIHISNILFSLWHGLPINNISIYILFAYFCVFISVIMMLFKKGKKTLL